MHLTAKQLLARFQGSRTTMEDGKIRYVFGSHNVRLTINYPGRPDMKETSVVGPIIDAWDLPQRYRKDWIMPPPPIGFHACHSVFPSIEEWRMEGINLVGELVSPATGEKGSVVIERLDSIHITC